MFEILSIVGARPQIIKAAAVSRAIVQQSGEITEVILHTGQHYDEMMSGVFFEELGIPHPTINLSVGSDSHGGQTAAMLKGIEQVILERNPDLVLIYGDTNSTLAGALAAAKTHMPLAHVEAGLRSFNKSMPEEINRIVADHCSTLLFCPTETAINNLTREGFAINGNAPYHIDNPALMLTGDVMFDNTLHYAKTAMMQSSILGKLGIQDGAYHLATVHRDNNTDLNQHLNDIIESLGEVSKLGDKPVVMPLHPRTRKSLDDLSLNRIRRSYPLLLLIEPLSFLDISRLEMTAEVIFTDSGGLQKEAFFHRKPVVILREETEWTEIVECGAGILAGASKPRIIDAFQHFSQNPPQSFPNVFGDGKAAENIVGILRHFFRAGKA